MSYNTQCILSFYPYVKITDTKESFTYEKRKEIHLLMKFSVSRKRIFIYRYTNLINSGLPQSTEFSMSKIMWKAAIFLTTKGPCEWSTHWHICLSWWRVFLFAKSSCKFPFCASMFQLSPRTYTHIGIQYRLLIDSAGRECVPGGCKSWNTYHGWRNRKILRGFNRNNKKLIVPMLIINACKKRSRNYLSFVFFQMLYKYWTIITYITKYWING